MNTLLEVLAIPFTLVMVYAIFRLAAAGWFRSKYEFLKKEKHD